MVNSRVRRRGGSLCAYLLAACAAAGVVGCGSGAPGGAPTASGAAGKTFAGSLSLGSSSQTATQKQAFNPAGGGSACATSRSPRRR